MKIKSLIVLVISLGVLAAILIIGYKIAPGVDSHSEVYEFNVGSERVINTINDFKRENTVYNIPKQIGLPDSLVKDNNTPDRMHGYIYYPKQQQIIHFWIRGGRKKTELHLVAVNLGLKLGNWKTINEDLTERENDNVKRQFEATVLRSLGLGYTNKGNNMALW
ncbi:hypothetical protein [Arcticibacter tournemirensis]